jgi:hypothetical protein
MLTRGVTKNPLPPRPGPAEPGPAPAQQVGDVVPPVVDLGVPRRLGVDAGVTLTRPCTFCMENH